MVDAFQRIVMWSMGALLLLCALLWPLARHADRRGRPGLLHGAALRLWQLPVSVLAALAAVFVGSVMNSGKEGGTNGVPSPPPALVSPVPASAPPPTVSSIFEYPRTVTGMRAAAGLALVGVGTNETFTFDPPTNATVCADWRMYGSASRWTHVSSTNFAFPFGGTNATTFTFVPGGVAEFAGGADAPRVAPFDAKMGIAPERYWDSLGVTSRFWTAASPSNTFLATWQGALLGRRADSPVDVQLELFPDGGFDFRYDLSRLASDGDLADAHVGAWNAGGGETYSVPHRNLTSARWRPVAPEDATDPDRDNDGVTTVDELFFLGTDPGNPDSDFDGLPDGDEIAHGLNPLDPYSNGGPYADGFALKIGDLNPLASPPDSDYTYYEHVVYSGSTNGTVTVPASTAAFALLEVDVTGTGTGDLVVGMQSLPLVGGASPVYLAVPRGSRLAVRLRRRTGSLSASLYSEDFAIGETPDSMGGDPSGWICFPRTRPVPEVACIHDLCGRKVDVRLEPGDGAEGIVASWWSSAAVAASNHADGVSATLTGNFDARHTARVWYELVHPQYLFGETWLPQSVRFCPRPSDADDEPEDEPEDDPEDEPDPDDPNEDLYNDNDGDEDTSQGGCDCCGNCALGGGDGCGHHAGEAPPDVSGPVPTEPPDPEDPEAPLPDCPVHNCPYSECYELHEDNAPRTVTVPSSTHVLTIGRSPSVDAVALAVPEGAVNCCPCPDHWTNYVGMAYKSGHLAVKDGNGLDFWKSETDCTVYVTGLTPTRAAAGAPLAFATNGAISVRRDYAVLGVDIDTPNGTVSLLNTLNQQFGIPATVCTNASRAAGIDLVTRVRLAAGAVTLTAGGGAFKAWLDRSNQGRPPLLLVDGTARPTVTMSLAKWRSLAGLTGDENEARTRILLTSATPGSRTLTFSFTAGGALADSVTQRVTFVRPPLRFDITRDGSIDEDDSAGWHNGRTFYYWINEDTIQGDYIAPGREYTTTNSADLVVNGTFDLVNFFPVALDLAAFTAAWQGRVAYRIRTNWYNPNSFNFCFADVPWSEAGSIQTTNVMTTSGHVLSAAPLTALPVAGCSLPYSDITSFSENSGLMICEAKSSSSLRIDIKDGDTVLYTYSVPITLLPVKQMYSWFNFRPLSGELLGRETQFHSLEGEVYVKSLIFLHGANVKTDEAEVWGDVLFKRLWLSGSRARFYNVDWRSDIGGPANYQENASNAFVVASQIAGTIQAIPGEKVIMAHSLGNVVVSSMIQDYGLQVSKYLMCNSAVPAEAYDTTLSPTNVLVHKAWNEYPRKSFANEWYRLFEDDVGDERQLLTWGGRFSSAASLAVNFYSTGDHVLELEQNNNVWATDGYENWDQKFEHYSWHKQEIWKGRAGILFNMGTTDWAGWSIRENMLGYNTIQPTNAWLMSGAELKTNTVFKLQPETMNTNSIPLLLRGALLAKGISSRTPASGATKWGPLSMNDSMYNLNSINTTQNGMSRPNGWISRPNGLFGSWGDRWLHSDMKDMAYFYVFKFFEKIKEEGELE